MAMGSSVFKNVYFRIMEALQDIKSDSLVIHYLKEDVNDHEIDGDTYLFSLINFSIILQEINAEIDPENKLRVKIEAVSEGGFNVILSLEMALIAHLFTGNAIEKIKTIKELFAWVLGIRKSHGAITINGDGNNVIIDNKGTIIIPTAEQLEILKNARVQKSITEAFKAIETDQSVTEVEIKNDESKEKPPLFLAARSDFEDMKTPADMTPKETRTVSYPNVPIIVHKIVFGSKKWSFKYKDRVINPTILDEVFWKKVESFEPFAINDKLRVELQVIQTLNEETGGYEDKDYTVLRVLRHESLADTTEGKLFNATKEP